MLVGIHALASKGHRVASGASRFRIGWSTSSVRRFGSSPANPERVKLTNIDLSAEEFDTFARLGGSLAHGCEPELETLLGETPGHRPR